MMSEGDFPNHIRRAVALTHGEVAVPHILFHTVTAAGLLAGLAPTAAAILATLGFQALAAWGVFWLARRSGAPVAFATCVGIGMVWVAPIFPLEVAADAPLYPYGYFVPNALHNPTVLAAKAFVPFLIVLGVMLTGASPTASRSSSIAIVVILAGLAKPHYVSCVLPVLAMVWAWRWWHGRQLSWRPILTFGIAAAAVLVWTAAGTVVLAGGGTPVVAPLAVLQTFGGEDIPVDALSIAARAGSDLAFPIAVLILWPSARRFRPLLLAWAAYGLALAQVLLLAEAGGRMHDGNFMWSPQLATFGVMAVSAAWVGRSSQRWNWRIVVASSVFVLHVAHGVWWIARRVGDADVPLNWLSLIAP